MKRIVLLMSLLAICFVSVMAQMPGAQQPVTWKFSVKMTGANAGELVMKATIAKGWHLYGFTQPENGPLPTTVNLEASTGLKFTGNIKTVPAPKKEHDALQGAIVNFWENTVTFTRSFTITDKAKARVKGTVRYMACNGETCMPPVTKELDIAVR